MAKKIATKKHTIIFDIDSSSVGAALVQYGYTENKKLISTIELFSVRKNITNATEYNFQEFFKRTCRTLGEVAHDVYLQSLVPLDEIIMNVGVPWSSSQKRILEHSAKKPFIFTQELFDKLIAHDSEISFNQNVDYAEHDVELIERKNLKVHGNGYPMRKPVGKEVSDVAIHSLTAVISTGTKKMFTDIIESVFHRAPRFISNTFVQYHEVRTLLPDVNNAVIVDISGEVTEVLIIQDDYLQHIGSVPVGTHAVIRHLCDVLNIPLAKGRTLIDLYHNGNLDHDAQNIHDAIKDSFKYWFREFYTLFNEYGKNGLLPNTLVVNAHTDVQSWFEELLMSEDSLKEHMHAQGRIELIHIPTRVSDGDDTRHIFTDTPLGIVAAYIGQE